MIKNLIAFAAAASMTATPVLAAELRSADEFGARRSGAAVGAYYSVPLSGTRAHKARGGVRLTMTHDYRHAGAPGARVVKADAIELRLIGKAKPTLYVAGQAVTGEEAKRNNLGPVTGIVSLAFLAAAAVGAYFIYKTVTDDDDDGPLPN